MTADSTDAEAWLSRASRDLAAAAAVLALEDQEGAAYLVQQAAEKALKGALLMEGKTPPRTHDLGWLLSRSERLSGLATDIEEFDQLTSWATIARYPMDEPMPLSQEEVQAAILRVERLMQTVRALLR